MVREKYTKDSLIPILRRPVTCGEQKHTVVVLLVVTGRSLQHLAFNLSEHNTDKMKRWLNPKLIIKPLLTLIGSLQVIYL